MKGETAADALRSRRCDHDSSSLSFLASWKLREGLPSSLQICPLPRMSRGMFDFIFPRGSEEARNLARPRGRSSEPSLNPLFRFESGVLCTQPGTRRVKAVRALLGRAGGSRRARSVFGILSSAIHNLSVRRYICKDDSIIARSAPSNLPLVPLVPLVCPLIRVARVAARERTRANSRGWIVVTSRGRSGRGGRARGARGKPTPGPREGISRAPSSKIAALRE